MGVAGPPWRAGNIKSLMMQQRMIRTAQWKKNIGSWSARGSFTSLPNVITDANNSKTKSSRIGIAGK